MDISAHAISLADRPRPGQTGHQCSYAPGRPILHLYLSSRRLRLETVDRGYVIACSSYRAVPFFEPEVPLLRPGPTKCSIASRAGAGGHGRAVARALCGGGLRRLPGRALTAPEARREDQAGRMPASPVLVSSKARPFASTAQAMRASLLASAIASTLWCNRLLAASIQDLSP